MPTILIIDDDDGLRESLAETVTDLGHTAVAAASGMEGLAALKSARIDAVLLDLRMPNMDGIEVLREIRKRTASLPVVVLTAFATAANTIEAMRLGAFDHLMKPIGRQELAHIIRRMLPPSTPAAVPSASVSSGTLIGNSQGMRGVQKAIGMLADKDTTVLILGETGTGKELVARALHAHGRRASEHFVPVNCAAIPADLLESELFGHVKGSFTGATSDRRGAFRDADKGTLFLDEIGDMPLVMQAKMLRALEERVVTPVGGRAIPVDVRVIAATHRDLARLVAEKQFREDLYYRLNVVPIVLPPLRDRREDIALLAQHFLSMMTSQAQQLSASALVRLEAYDWPGNIRQLRNVIQRAAALGRGTMIEPSDLVLPPPAILVAPGADSEGKDLSSAVADLERRMIETALGDAHGNRAEAARRLGINRQLLYTKMQRYGLMAVSEKLTPGVGDDDT